MPKGSAFQTKAAYDAENNLTDVSGPVNVSFTYDGDGNRVKSSLDGQTTVYIGGYSEWTGSTSTMKKYYSAGANRIAVRTGDGTGDAGLLYLLGDHLGSTTVAANPDGTLNSKQLYMPFGESRYTSGSLPTDYKFTGQMEEPEIGLYFYNARYYDPYLGRFISPDSIVPQPENPLAWDRYAYTLNNPIRYRDPSGHNVWDTIGQFATGMVFEFSRTTAWASPQAQEVLSVSATESTAMLAGRVAGDIAAIIVGVEEVTTGIAVATAGTAVSCAATLCTTAVVTVGAGAVVVGVGASTAMAGAAGLGSNLAQLNGKTGMLGESGTQFSSKTLWKNKLGRLDVENPDPGQRPGQIHFQQGKNKWIYDPKTNSFKPVKGTSIDPPGWLKDLLGDKDFQNAIQKGLQYLGE